MNPLILLAISIAPSIVHFLIGLVVVLLICGLIAMLVSRAPLAEPWKGWIQWCLLAIPVIYVVLFLLQFV